MELPFSPHERLTKQVVQLESSVDGITSRIDLIMEKLGLQQRAKRNQTAGKQTVTNDDVRMELGLRYSKTMNTLNAFKWKT